MINEEILNELREPRTVEELNIPQNILIDILLRLLYNEGNVNFRRIVQVMRVPFILDKQLAWMREQNLVEIYKSTTALSHLNYIYKLTKTGVERAHEAMERSQYVGPVPVSVGKYNQLMEIQTKNKHLITSKQVQQALADLILPDGFHRLIGPAINSGSSLFLYGPSGNGKTAIAQKIASLISGSQVILMPYAITAGGQVIQIYDRLHHHAVSAEGVEKHKNLDGRWGVFRRPCVIVGSELRMESLELRYDPVMKTYEAPLQLKANGGMFLIDDFGRQQIDPSDLLNRWFIPLENNVDFLRLRAGQTLVVPFRTLLVFSTNLDLHNLADDAFLRRIQMKVGVLCPDEDRYRRIFIKEASYLGIPYDEKSFIRLLDNWYRSMGRKLQAVHPRDLLKILKAISAYEGIPVSMNPALIDEACKSYFVV